MQAECSYLLEEGSQSGSRNRGSQSFNKGRVFLQGRVERFIDLVDALKISSIYVPLVIPCRRD